MWEEFARRYCERTEKVRRPSDILQAITFEPFLRVGQSVADASVNGKVLAVALSGVAYVRGEVFFIVMSGWLLAFCADWYLGRILAVKRGVFDPEISKARTMVKLSSLLLVMIVWMMAHAVGEHFLQVDWGKIPGLVLMVLLTLDECDSVEAKRIALKGRPIPFWSDTLSFLRKATKRAGPVDDSDK